MPTPLHLNPLAVLWRRLRQKLPAQAALAWLLLALVAAPTLGRLHQVEHAGAIEQVRAGHAGHALPGTQHGRKHATGAAGQGEALSAAADPTQGLHGHGHGHGHEHEQQGQLLRLLPSHAPVDCLLLDQLALGDALHSAPQALPAAVLAQAPPSQHVGRFAAQHVALFQARGPPTA